MPKIVFEGENKECEVEVGTKIMSACDQVESNIPFGCRRGVCGTCVTEIVEGIDKIAPENIQEESTRKDIDAKPTQRLACQARVRGDIKIHAA